MCYPEGPSSIAIIVCYISDSAIIRSYSPFNSQVRAKFPPIFIFIIAINFFFVSYLLVPPIITCTMFAHNSQSMDLDVRWPNVGIFGRR